MGCKHWMLLVAVAVAGLTGCQNSTNSSETASSPGAPAQAERAEAPTAQTPAANTQVHTPPTDTSTPAGATAVFLDALRRGDDERLLGMYTTRARQQANELNQHFAPRGSDTAQYTVGRVESVAENLVGVACTWTDLDQDGNPHTLEFVWTLRQEPEGWRVSGMAVTPFPGEAPVFLDFENLSATLSKVDKLAEEIARRQKMAASQPQQAKKSEAPALL